MRSLLSVRFTVVAFWPSEGAAVVAETSSPMRKQATAKAAPAPPTKNRELRSMEVLPRSLVLFSRVNPALGSTAAMQFWEPGWGPAIMAQPIDGPGVYPTARGRGRHPAKPPPAACGTSFQAVRWPPGVQEPSGAPCIVMAAGR